MIRSFADRRTARLFLGLPVRGIAPELARAALRKLQRLDSVEDVLELRVPPGNRLERLHGQRVGTWSIRVNDQWRIVFVWRDGHAHEVELVDYH